MIDLREVIEAVNNINENIFKSFTEDEFDDNEIHRFYLQIETDCNNVNVRFLDQKIWSDCDDDRIWITDDYQEKLKVYLEREVNEILELLNKFKF